MEGEIFVSVTYFCYLCTCMWYTKGERQKEGGREGEMLYKAMYVVHEVWEKKGRERGGRH